MIEVVPPRLHILAAKDAPVALILRRKPNKTWHVIRWDLAKGTLEHGSWFKGTLYPMRCDLSWDGTLMTYLAMAADAHTTWNGVCAPPFLKTLAEWDNIGTWNGGGVWLERSTLYRNLSVECEVRLTGAMPPKIRFKRLPTWKGEDLSIIFFRLYRDGFRPIVKGSEVDPLNSEFEWRPEIRMADDCVWVCRRNGLKLTTQWVGYKYKRGYKGHFGVFGKEAGPGYRDRTGYIFRFELEGHPELLGPPVEWATWAATGDLLYAKEGCVFRLRKPKPGALGEPEVIDLNVVERVRRER